MVIELCPTPWRIETNDQHGKHIVAANGSKVYANPLYIDEESARFFPDDPCKQYRLAGSQLMHSTMYQIVSCMNACKNINPDAVPDLLAALQEFIRFVDLPNIVQRGDKIRYQIDAISAARAAIKKAGE